MNLRELTIKRRAEYKSIVSVDCPILKETIYFTSDGFNHLLYTNRKPRNVKERYLKLMYMEHVTEIITKCKKVSETREEKHLINGVLKSVTFYELNHRCNGENIRVVVKRVGTGKHIFMSIMPNGNRRKTKKAV